MSRTPASAHPNQTEHPMSKHKPIDIAEFRVEGGKKVDLADWPTKDRAVYDSKSDYEERLDAGTERLAELQEMLYAHDRYSLLVIFQAMDAAGKDGAIRHVMSGINPQGCQVFSFKHPSPTELDHDFLWRTHVALPERGRIGIFNRSYYEEVLVVRVHPSFLDAQRLPARPPLAKLWQQRYEDINRDGILQLAELSLNPDVIVLATPEIAGMPYVVSGLVAAGGLAAALSTADGLLLTITSALSHDVYYRVFRPASSTQLRLVISKSLLLVVAVLAATVAAQKPGTILSMVAWAFSIAGSAFFPALVLGIFWRRATRAGALAGMIVGLSVAAYYIFRVEVGSLAWLGLGSLRMQPWFHISSTAAGVFGVAAGFAVIIVVSLFTKAPDKEVERFLNAIRRVSPAKGGP